MTRVQSTKNVKEYDTKPYGLLDTKCTHELVDSMVN